jgi:uncharacterized damage-inducible protein DinB
VKTIEGNLFPLSRELGDSYSQSKLDRDISRSSKETFVEIFLQDVLSLMDKLHKDALLTFEDLPQEALDWTPGPDINSFCVLIVHMTGAERYWIGDVAGEQPSGRVREEEFQAQGLDHNTLRKRLADSLKFAHEILESLSLQDLERQRISPRNGQNFTVGWALSHALEHTALHVGHMQILRQWWDQERGGA